MKMTPDADRGEQTVRQWRLLIALSARRYGATLDELSRDLEVHARTIRRDLAVLGRVGFVLERDRDPDSREIRVRIPPGLRERNIPFTLGELLSLHFASRMMRGLSGTPMKEGIDTALQRIEMALPVHALEHVERARIALLAKPMPGKPYQRHARTIETLQQAVAERRKVEVGYRAYGRRSTDRHVYRPYLMTWCDGALYAMGWSELREGMRTFAIDRVMDARLREEHFDLPAGFDPDAYVRECFGIYRDPNATQAHRVLVEFAREAAQRVREREWHPTQRLKSLAGGRVLLEMRVVGLEDVMRWILGFGALARVREPAELVERVSRELHHAASAYPAGGSKAAAGDGDLPASTLRPGRRRAGTRRAGTNGNGRGLRRKPPPQAGPDGPSGAFAPPPGTGH